MVTAKLRSGPVEIKDLDDLYRIVKEVRAEREDLVIQADGVRRDRGQTRAQAPEASPAHPGRARTENRRGLPRGRGQLAGASRS